ncbi:RNA 3'-terminal phosphate cyclase [Acinetobacter wuhouensis]|uniref:RNA 3'-terminal phosphate cyclase n=1 Tax=Acinetobacter wuhouensis TaxID=1879050 RepID=A0A3G2T4H1_9GAMM|nr:RNA 3'-terminal phosphate cyclase [Acinetobacter wuhouensis]AYO54875.1 RNA 3'-terminal phosphate cyclase [Acinetobacter wuhouensis]
MNARVKNKTIRIDGSQGEGGGQILRTALSLSMLTGIPFELVNIRAGRKKPGLMRQHLVCVQASQRISNATVEGAELHSQRLYFQPQQVQAGHYNFQIGSAGSTILVLQTLLPVLMMQDKTSQIIIHGGTHNPMAPTADFIEQCFLPTIQRLEIYIDFECERAGFFPIGAGQINATIHPWAKQTKYTALDRGKLIEINGYASALNIPSNIADRELEVLHNKLDLNNRKRLNFQGISQGNTAFVVLNYEHHQQVFSALGEMKKSAEKVAHDLAKEVKAYLATEAIADEYLADQLLLPMALGQGGEFTAQIISEHTKTQAEMIQKFINCEIKFENLNNIFKVSVCV